jgi:hypothetical protein
MSFALEDRQFLVYGFKLTHYVSRLASANAADLSPGIHSFQMRLSMPLTGKINLV